MLYKIQNRVKMLNGNLGFKPYNHQFTTKSTYKAQKSKTPNKQVHQNNY